MQVAVDSLLIFFHILRGHIRNFDFVTYYNGVDK